MQAIKWTRDEAVAFLDKVVEEFRANPNGTRRAVIDAAMLKVPESRRRNIASVNQINAEGWSPPADVAHFFARPKAFTAAPQPDEDGLPPMPDPSMPLRERQSMMAKRMAAQKKLKLAGQKEVRIFWSEGERAQLVTEAARLIFENQGPEPVHMQDAIRQAQSVLPPARRRSLPAIPVNLTKALKVELDRLRENARKAPPPPQPKVEDMRLNLDAGEGPEAPGEEPELPQASPRQEPAPSATVGALDAIADAFGRWASRYLAKIMVGAVKEVLTDPNVGALMQAIKATPDETSSLLRLIASGPPKPAQRHNPEPESAARQRRPVVLVCGMLPRQQGDILKAFPELHLKFWYSENPATGLESLRAKAEGADVVLFKLAQSSHSASQIVKNMGKRLVMVGGSQVEMANALRSEVARLNSLERSAA